MYQIMEPRICHLREAVRMEEIMTSFFRRAAGPNLLVNPSPDINVWSQVVG